MGSDVIPSFAGLGRGCVGRGVVARGPQSSKRSVRRECAMAKQPGGVMRFDLGSVPVALVYCFFVEHYVTDLTAAVEG